MGFLVAITSIDGLERVKGALIDMNGHRRRTNQKHCRCRCYHNEASITWPTPLAPPARGARPPYSMSSMSGKRLGFQVPGTVLFMLWVQNDHGRSSLVYPQHARDLFLPGPVTSIQTAQYACVERFETASSLRSDDGPFVVLAPIGGNVAAPIKLCSMRVMGIFRVLDC